MDYKNRKYKDPIYYFSPSIGISSIIESKDFHPRWSSNWLVGSLKARTLYRAHILDNKIISVEPIWIGDRIRDIVELNQKIVILTDQATIIILEVDSDQLKKNTRYNNLDAGGLYISLNDKLKKCVQCHSFTETNPTSLAPSLHNIFNRKIASDNYQNYSSALKSKSDLIWSYDNLLSFINDPNNFSPGTSMPYLELEKGEIDDIINLLKKQSLQ
jgi:cytochrome c2